MREITVVEVCNLGQQPIGWIEHPKSTQGVGVEQQAQEQVQVSVHRQMLPPLFLQLLLWTNRMDLTIYSYLQILLKRK